MVEMPEANPPEPETEAGEASAEEGVVVLDGPDGVAVSIQPEPAAETGQRLIDAAKKAREQQGGASD
jgi:hypothetical protein